MAYKLRLGFAILFTSTCLFGQDDLDKKHRLDFAKTYFEYGGSYYHSFEGKKLESDQLISFTHPASINQYLTWGGFHFWGHAEFYVTIPLMHTSLIKEDQDKFTLLHSVATGARYYPWVVRERKIRPYVGASWGALDFKQDISSSGIQPLLSKDFLLNAEAGLTYQHKKFGARLGFHFFHDHTWKYPISKSVKTDINTPAYSIQLGIMYSFDATKSGKNAPVVEWNSYPRNSKLSHKASRFGDFFIGAGPSTSYSLVKSKHNQSRFPYLKEKLTSSNYFDIAIGYQYNKANLFTALSFRNPTFQTEGFGTRQEIQKNSLTLEVNHYITDFSGFAPYVGLNIAYENLKYTEEVDGVEREFHFKNQIEPGFTMGWDIVPGKTAEALILRTNLRWYPFSEFQVEGKEFNFSQLEYNLIQVVFYFGRL